MDGVSGSPQRWVDVTPDDNKVKATPWCWQDARRRNAPGAAISSAYPRTNKGISASW